MTTAAFTLLQHAAENRERWLRRFYEIGKDAVRPRNEGELYGFIIPPSENSGKIISILERGGVEVDFPIVFTLNGRRYPQDTAVVRMAQPYGAFAKALLEKQRYPDLRDSSNHPIAPYDATAHTLPLLMGVHVDEVTTPFKLPRSRLDDQRGWNGGCGGPNPPRRAIYSSHVPSMDAGWTRWVLEHQSRCLFHLLITDKEIQQGDLKAKFDTILIPDQSVRNILNGYAIGAMPTEYTGGIGPEGVKALGEFAENGGTLVFLNRASDFAIQQFKLPLRNVVAGLPRTDFYVPGSILRLELDATHPLAAGMPKDSIAWAEDSPVFEVVNKSHDGVGPSDVRIIGWYPRDKDPLLSGWLLGGERIKGKAALVEVKVGKGRMILFGFRPQYRAQSLATYPLLFSALR
jgi:hypothetical protein